METITQQNEEIVDTPNSPALSQDGPGAEEH